MLGGLGGIVYIIAGVSEWKFENGVAGFGFLALAVMIFGQWKPQRIALAALLFGFIEALGLRLQKYVPSDLTGMAPYLVTVIMMVAVVLWERKKKNKAVKAEE